MTSSKPASHASSMTESIFQAEIPIRNRWAVALLWPLLFGWVIGCAIALGFGIGFAAAAIIGAVAGAALVLAVLALTTKVVASQLGAVPAHPKHDALYFHTVRALCLASGLEPPKLTITVGDVPVVASYGIRTAAARLCISRELFSRLSAVEQEAVIAHGLSRIHQGAFRSDSLATFIFGFVLKPLGLSRLTGRCARHLRGSEALLAADLAATRLTRFPPGVAAALTAIQQAETPVQPEYLDHLMMLPAYNQDERVEHRISVLREI